MINENENLLFKVLDYINFIQVTVMWIKRLYEERFLNKAFGLENYQFKLVFWTKWAFL